MAVMGRGEGDEKLGWGPVFGRESEHPYWALLPGAKVPHALAGRELCWPVEEQRWPPQWGLVVEGGYVFEPWAVIDEVLRAFEANPWGVFEAERCPAWVFAWHGLGGWRVALIDRAAAEARALVRDTDDDSTPVLWVPLPELRLLPMLGSMLLESPGILADWFEERVECAAAERLRAGTRTPLEFWGPEDNDF